MKVNTGNRYSHRIAPLLYVLGVIFVAILFFSNDFGLVDIQKTAIILAVGVDREENDFVVTSQIAVPSSSPDSKASAEAIQVETRGETIGAAIQKINEKTGWYPKLVFCNLILLGNGALNKNVFECLDYFLRNDYMSDDCLVCCCEEKAGELLSTQTSVEKVSSLAVVKILSEHAAKAGLVAPVSLREFAVGYFGGGSGILPVLKTGPLSSPPEQSGENGNSQGGNSQGGGSQGESGGGGGGGGGGGQGEKSAEKTFTAAETALFNDGAYLGKLTSDETFALQFVRDGMRLASLNVEYAGVQYTLLIKKGEAKVEFFVDEYAAPRLYITLDMKAGLQDSSSSQTINEIASPEKINEAVLACAKDKLTKLLKSTFEKSRALGCDVFDVKRRLQKYEPSYFSAYRETVLERLLFYTKADISPAR